MALPIVNSSRYTTTIPSTGQKVDFRPYVVKEEKLLLVAFESKSDKMIVKALKDVIQACILDDIDMNKLTSFDVEHLFLQLRSKSVGEKIEVKLKCESCETLNEVVIDLNNTEIANLTNIEDNIIMITDKIGVKLNHILMKDLENEDESIEADSYEKILDLIINCTEMIFDDKKLYDKSNTTSEEIKEFYESLRGEQFAKVSKFFENSPYLKYDLHYKCSSCGHENKYEIKGLSSFFILASLTKV
jgi:ribosomal protein L44E